jgi:hypothetical protein
VKDFHSWQQLLAHRDGATASYLHELFAADGTRFARFSLYLDGMLIGYSKHLSDETFALLIALGREAGVIEWNAPVPVDFIACVRPNHDEGEHQAILLANCLPQSQALMRGKTADEARAEMEVQKLTPETIERLLPHKTFPGN